MDFCKIFLYNVVDFTGFSFWTFGFSRIVGHEFCYEWQEVFFFFILYCSIHYSIWYCSTRFAYCSIIVSIEDNCNFWSSHFVVPLILLWYQTESFVFSGTWSGVMICLKWGVGCEMKNKYKERMKKERERWDNLWSEELVLIMEDLEPFGLAIITTQEH